MSFAPFAAHCRVVPALLALLASLTLVGRTTSTQASQPAAGGEDVVRIRGQVIDPDGKPVQGATVAVPSPRQYPDRLTKPPIALTKSGPDGRYEISYTKSDLPAAPGPMGVNMPVVASAEGFGIAWSYPPKGDAGDLVLQLVPDDVPIRGRIVDLEGRPVANVKVTVDLLTTAATEKELEAAAEKGPEQVGAMTLWLPLLATNHTEPIVTGADGTFRVTGLGRDRRVFMHLHGPTIGYSRIEAMTRPMKPEVRAVPQPRGDETRYITYGATFDHAEGPGRSVMGVVKDAKTGKPMAGVTVESLRVAGRFIGINPRGAIHATTDEQGRYRLDGFPKGAGNAVIVSPADDSPYFARQAAVDDAPGLAPITVDLDMHTGVVVTGKVTDKNTGQPVAASVTYTTYLDNPHAANLPAFNRAGGGGMIDGFQPATTKADGTYRLIAAPGKAVIAATSLVGGYRKGIGFDKIERLKGLSPETIFQLYQPAPYPQVTDSIVEIDIPADARTASADVQLDPGERIRVAVEDDGGEPLTGPLLVRGHTPDNVAGAEFARLEGPTIELPGCAPGDVRTLYVIDENRKIGRAMRVEVDEARDRPASIRLLPFGEVTGRLLTTDGQPLRGAYIESNEVADTDMRDAAVAAMQMGGRTVHATTTDEKGRFRCRLLYGTTYNITVTRGAYAGASVAQEVSPQPGETRNLIDIRVSPRMTQ